jgi:hypothetical protein
MPGRERSASMIPTKTHNLLLRVPAAAAVRRRARAVRTGDGPAAGHGSAPGGGRAGRLSAG